MGAWCGPMSPGSAYTLLNHWIGEVNGRSGAWGWVHGGMGGLSNCLAEGGSILGLLPLNEITPDENHKWICDRNLVEEWAAAAGCRVADYLECDHWVYYTLPVFQGRCPGGSFAAQALGLGLGLAASCFSPRAWFGLGRVLLGPLGAKPTQAVFLLEKK